MSEVTIGDVNYFAIQYAFFDDLYSTEISMIVNGDNILSFSRDGEHRTTRWDLDELAEWLRDFIDHMQDDPYPVDVKGGYAALMDWNARDFESEDQEVFDQYYDRLNEWVWRHTWHHARAGAILSDVFFRLVGDQVEISWDNRTAEGGVQFDSVLGCGYVSKKMFVDVMNRFLQDYASHWFG